MSSNAGARPITRRVRALVVDDDEDMRVLVTNVIETANQGLEVVGEAGGGEEGLLRWRELRPDVIVLDQRMRGLTGVQVAERILAEDPDQRIVLFSAYVDDVLTGEALEAGVCSVLDKDRYRDLPAALWTCVG